MDIIENIYGKALRLSFAMLNPFKKALIKTQCEVHKFINILSLEILKNDGYQNEFNFYSKYIEAINNGAVWADQDFKSSTHMYNPYTKKGLYGRKNAMDITKQYYNKSIELWFKGEDTKSLFYFGAAIHILQDMTIPQHANVRLLDNHRQYENFIRKTYTYVKEFRVEGGAYILDTIEEYIKFNARIALNIYKRFKNIKSDEERFYRVARCTLPLAERTTAGCMVTFYNDVIRKRYS